MKKLLLSRGMYAVRALAAFLMVAGFLAAGSRTTNAQEGESGLDGNTFTSPNFGWSVEWDEDVWTFEADSENNEDGSDFFQLTTVDEEGPFAIATFFAGEGYSGDPDDCVAGYEDTLADIDGNSDVAESDEFDLPETPEDGAGTNYTYTAALDSGDLELIDYASCVTIVEDEAVLIFSVTTTPNVFEDIIPIVDDLAAEITVPDAGNTDQDDEDVTPDADEDEDVTPEADEDSSPRRRTRRRPPTPTKTRTSRQKPTKKRRPKAMRKTPSPPAMSSSEMMRTRLLKQTTMSRRRTPGSTTPPTPARLTATPSSGTRQSGRPIQRRN